MCERELGTEQRLQHIDPPQLFWLSQPFFPVLLGCSTGGLGAQRSAESWFPQLDLEHWLEALNSNSKSGVLRASSAGCWFSLQHLISNYNWPELPKHRVMLLFYAHSIQTVDRMHLLSTQVHFLFWQLGRVGGQYATLVWFLCLIAYQASWVI